MDTENPNADDGFVKMPSDPAALLFVPTEQDAERLYRALEENRRAAEEGFEGDDPTLWAELVAQLEKQRE